MNQENLEDRIISERELDAVLREKLIKMINDIDKKEISKEVKPKPEDKRRIELEDGEKVKPLPKHPKHLPPKHKLQGILNIEEDFETLISVFGDEFTAEAAIKILEESPVEIQIIAKITMNLYNKVDKICGE